MGTLIFINQIDKMKTTAFQCQRCGKSSKIITGINTPVREKICDSCADEKMILELALK